jgi:hypothetical protein
MITRSRLLLAAVVAALTLAAGVQAASANRLMLSNQSLSIAWNVVKIANSGARIEIKCPMTLEGSFHSRTLSKVSGQLIGYITRALLMGASCNSRLNTTTTLFLNGIEAGTNTLPWHIRYDSFAGRLPAITSVRIQIIGASILVNALGFECLYQSTAGLPLFADANIEVGSTVSSLKFVETASIPRFMGNMLCPQNVIFEGTSNAPVLQGTTNTIRITLVQ